MSGGRIGVFGGMFDPPHHGHLIVASEAFEALSLDRLIFVPAGDPPHKEGTGAATPEQRVRMLEAATCGDPRFAVDDLELHRPGPSYTVDTLRALRARDPDAELIFLLGIDQFRVFASWREPEEIVRLARLAIVARAGEDPEVGGAYGGVRVSVSRIDISSSRVRNRAAEGLGIHYYVPEAVLEVIEAEGLYGSASRGCADTPGA